jgi:outer membrane protein assembly factor BamD
MKIKPVLCLLVVFVLFIGGCGDRKLPEEKSASELVAEGQVRFDRQDYNSAIAYFQRVKDWYPFSELVTTAELKVAESHYMLKEYDQAADAYQEFANLHPRNPSTPYAYYQIGNCYFVQMGTIDRDQTSAKKAAENFARFISRYPDNEYTELAKANLRECQKSLASNELLVARYQFKKKNYKAALKRFRIVLDDYPDVGIQHIVLQYIAKCESKLGNTASN